MKRWDAHCLTCCSFRMTQLWRAVVVFSVGVASASPRDFVPFFGREQRSLVNTFPFNDVNSQLPERETRQGLDNSVSSIPFSAVASSYAGGKRWEISFLMIRMFHLLLLATPSFSHSSPPPSLLSSVTRNVIVPFLLWPLLWWWDESGDLDCDSAVHCCCSPRWKRWSFCIAGSFSILGATAYPWPVHQWGKFSQLADCSSGKLFVRKGMVW